jgi:hypothetical protein
VFSILDGVLGFKPASSASLRCATRHRSAPPFVAGSTKVAFILFMHTNFQLFFTDCH